MKKKSFFYKKAGKLIVIGPTKKEIEKILQALLLIKKTDKKEYWNAQSRMKIIFISNMSGFTNEFFMPEKIWFANKSVIGKNDLPWLASLIIHEGFHATQFKKGKYILPLGNKIELPALRVQKIFLEKIDGADKKKEIESTFKEKYWSKMACDKKSFSYFRHLLDLLENKKINLIKA